MATVESNGEVTGLWITVSELARQRGVDKAAVSRRVKRFEAQGLISTRSGPQGSKLINLAEFDRASGQVTDGVRELNGNRTPAPRNVWPFHRPDPVLSREQARRTSYDADLKKLELDEKLGKVVQIDFVESAMARAAESIVRKLEQLPSRADEIVSAMTRDGSAGVKRVLEVFVTDLCASLQKALDISSIQAATFGENENG